MKEGKEEKKSKTKNFFIKTPATISYNPMAFIYAILSLRHGWRIIPLFSPSPSPSPSPSYLSCHPSKLPDAPPVRQDCARCPPLIVLLLSIHSQSVRYYGLSLRLFVGRVPSSSYWLSLIRLSSGRWFCDPFL